MTKGQRRQPDDGLERLFHRSVIQFLARALPPDAVVHHSPNEAIRRWNAGLLSGLGVQSGWPDIEIAYRGKMVFLELKRRGGVASDEQIAVAARLRAAGCRVTFCRNLEEVAAELRAAGIPCIARVAA